MSKCNTNLDLADLQSKRSSLVKKAAKKILKERLKGYGPALHEALEIEIEKPRAWETQITLINALAATNCVDELGYLKELIKRDYKATVLYRNLAMAIVYLENSGAQNLISFEQFLQSDNSLIVAGACAGMCMRELVLTSPKIEKILTIVMQPLHLEYFGQILNPIYFVLGASYFWSKADQEKIIQACKKAGLDTKSSSFNRYLTDLEAGKQPKGIKLF